jgi:hypothetical protein
MSFEENTVVYLDDVFIPHTWESILDNINNKLYFKVYENPAVEYHLTATIEPGNYIGGDLAAEIQKEMNSNAETATGVADLFTCEYVVKTNKIRIKILNDPVKAFLFRIITQPELKTVDWNGTPFNRNKPNDINEVLSN